MLTSFFFSFSSPFLGGGSCMAFTGKNTFMQLQPGIINGKGSTGWLVEREKNYWDGKRMSESMKDEEKCTRCEHVLFSSCTQRETTVKKTSMHKTKNEFQRRKIWLNIVFVCLLMEKNRSARQWRRRRRFICNTHTHKIYFVWYNNNNVKSIN